METKAKLEALFASLDGRIRALNIERGNSGALKISRTEIRLLGQMSLLANDKVAATLPLAQTADVDAILLMDDVVKREFRELLAREGFVYDDDSHLVWIPPGGKFEPLFRFPLLEVTTLDPESALVSKAVKAPEKNPLLVRQAIAKDLFSGLVERIEKSGGNLEFFA